MKLAAPLEVTDAIRNSARRRHETSDSLNGLDVPPGVGAGSMRPDEASVAVGEALFHPHILHVGRRIRAQIQCSSFPREHLRVAKVQAICNHRVGAIPFVGTTHLDHRIHVEIEKGVELGDAVDEPLRELTGCLHAYDTIVEHGRAHGANGREDLGVGRSVSESGGNDVESCLNVPLDELLRKAEVELCDAFPYSFDDFRVRNERPKVIRYARLLEVIENGIASKGREVFQVLRIDARVNKRDDDPDRVDLTESSAEELSESDE